MVRGIACALAVFVFAVSSPVLAAGPFDGEWEGNTEKMPTCGPAIMKFTVKDSEISGRIKGDRGEGTLSGSIKSDGSAYTEIGKGGNHQGSFQFSGDAFTGNLHTRCGIPNVKGIRTKK